MESAEGGSVTGFLVETSRCLRWRRVTLAAATALVLLTRVRYRGGFRKGDKRQLKGRKLSLFSQRICNVIRKEYFKC